MKQNLFYKIFNTFFRQNLITFLKCYIEVKLTLLHDTLNVSGNNGPV